MTTPVDIVHGTPMERTVMNDTNGILDGRPVERAPELDSDESEAWRRTEACDDDCGHAIHALGHPEPRLHVEWFPHGQAPVTPHLDAVPERPVSATLSRDVR